MTVTINGKLARTIPITAGKDGFTTRSGVKVIMEKYPIEADGRGRPSASSPVTRSTTTSRT